MTKTLSPLAVDTETTGLNRWIGARPFALSAYDGERSWWWEWTVDPETRVPIIPARDKREIRLLLASRSQPKVFFNAGFDILMLEAIGIRVQGPIEELSFKARAVHNLLPVYKLKALADKYFSNHNLVGMKPEDAAYLAGLRSQDEVELHKWTVRARRIARKLGWNRAKAVQADYWMIETLWRLHPEVAKEKGLKRGVCKIYGVKDAERTWWLNSIHDYALRTMDAQDRRNFGVAQDVAGTYRREMELLPTTIDMQRRGVCIDLKVMRKLQTQCVADKNKALRVMQVAASDMLGIEDFNPNSPAQVARLLFSEEGMGLEPLGYTKQGVPKTGAEFIIPYKQRDLVRELLRFRASEKAITTFFGKYEDLCEPLKGHSYLAILHPCFHQWGALTGRYTCTDPNLQQVSDPTTTNSRVPEFMVNVRAVFRPRPGTVWYCPDYEQVEVIIFADIAGEQTMLDAIKDGRDIHTATTNKVWGGVGNPKTVKCVERVLELAGDKHAHEPKRIAEIIEEHAWDICSIENTFKVKVWRKLGKTVTFTKIFGGGAGALMSWIGCSKSEAYKILADYDTAFPDMRAKMDEIILKAREQMFVVNPFGRRLTIDKFYPYRAVSYIVQSAAADLMKAGMRKCAAYLLDVGIEAHILMTIHDEIIFEFNKLHAFRSVLRRLCELMSDHGGVFSVATPVSMDKVTTSWSNKEKVDLAV